LKVSLISLKNFCDESRMLKKAPEGSAQQGFHLVSFGQDENLVIGCSLYFKEL